MPVQAPVMEEGMSSKELHFLELTEISGLLHSREISPVALTRAMLERIQAIDPKLHSYALVTADLALEQARGAEAEIVKGNVRGPLHGVPIAIKDNCFTKGIVTTNGMAIRRDAKPGFDATVVARLREAGAVMLGKLQQTEGAFADHHPSVTPPVNPWNAAHWAGASSSGSGVATAAGLSFGSLGSDTGGSIRLPCDANGVTGIKPTYGRVSRYGVFENSATLDHVGPMTRSAADAGAILGAMAGRDENDPTTSFAPVPDYLARLDEGVRGLRIGVDPQYISGADPEVVRVLEAALDVMRGLGATVQEVNFPNPDQIVADWIPHSAIEMAVAHEATYPARKSEYGATLAGFIELGLQQSGISYEKYITRRNDFRGRVEAVFRTIDLLAIPTQCRASPTLDHMAKLGEDQAELLKLVRFTCPFDMTGSPTITLPGGQTDAGMPITFQFVSRHLEEDLLVRAGHAFQSATDWHKRHPAL
jgi:amidase